MAGEKRRNKDVSEYGFFVTDARAKTPADIYIITFSNSPTPSDINIYRSIFMDKIQYMSADFVPCSFQEKNMVLNQCTRDKVKYCINIDIKPGGNNSTTICLRHFDFLTSNFKKITTGLTFHSIMKILYEHSAEMRDEPRNIILRSYTDSDSFYSLTIYETQIQEYSWSPKFGTDSTSKRQRTDDRENSLSKVTVSPNRQHPLGSRLGSSPTPPTPTNLTESVWGFSPNPPTPTYQTRSEWEFSQIPPTPTQLPPLPKPLSLRLDPQLDPRKLPPLDYKELRSVLSQVKNDTELEAPSPPPLSSSLPHHILLPPPPLPLPLAHRHFQANPEPLMIKQEPLPANRASLTANQEPLPVKQEPLPAKQEPLPAKQEPLLAKHELLQAKQKTPNGLYNFDTQFIAAALNKKLTALDTSLENAARISKNHVQNHYFDSERDDCTGKLDIAAVESKSNRDPRVGVPAVNPTGEGLSRLNRDPRESRDSRVDKDPRLKPLAINPIAERDPKVSRDPRELRIDKDPRIRAFAKAGTERDPKASVTDRDPRTSAPAKRDPRAKGLRTTTAEVEIEPTPSNLVQVPNAQLSIVSNILKAFFARQEAISKKQGRSMCLINYITKHKLDLSGFDIARALVDELTRDDN